MTMLLRAAICGAVAISVVNLFPVAANAKQTQLGRRAADKQTQLLPSVINAIVGGASTYNHFDLAISPEVSKPRLAKIMIPLVGPPPYKQICVLSLAACLAGKAIVQLSLLSKRKTNERS